MTPSTPIRWQPIALLVGVVGLYLWSNRPATPPEGWTADFNQAVTEAKATGKNLLVAFNLHGCAPCAMMDRQVMPEPRVREAIASFVPVRVNLRERPDIAQRFGVEGAPTYLVVDANGTILDGRSGFVPIDEFLAFLDQASTESETDSQ
ncbi:MAG: thioredoxin family protein [Planctomycetes bacterium]|nr:thioredoxin family protein [Planctomycetota bacterium]